MSEDTSPSPAAEGPKQTPEELIQGSDGLATEDVSGVAAALGDAAAGEPAADGVLADAVSAEETVAVEAVAVEPAAVEGAFADLAPVDDDVTDELGELLRDRMLQAVSGIEPKPGTLEYLHYAVPARRKRRHTALATTAVTVFAVSTAVTLAGRGMIGGGGHGSDTGAQVGQSLTTTSDTVHGGGGSHNPGTGSGSHTPVPAYATAATTPGVTPPSKSESYVPPPVGTASVPLSLPNCQNSSMSSVVPTAGPTIDGVSYETVTATAATACSIAGPPQLMVLDAAGSVSSKVGIFKADGIAAPGLAAVPTWGRVLVLKPGDMYQFQFAWVPTACPVATPPPTTTPPTPPSSSPTSNGSPSGSPSSAAAGAPTASAAPSTAPVATTPAPNGPPPSPVSLTVAYSVYGAQPIANATFSETCGAAVYVTDIFQAGEYPAPRLGGVAQNAAPSS